MPSFRYNTRPWVKHPPMGKHRPWVKVTFSEKRLLRRTSSAVLRRQMQAREQATQPFDLTSQQAREKRHTLLQARLARSCVRNSQNIMVVAPAARHAGRIACHGAVAGLACRHEQDVSAVSPRGLSRIASHPPPPHPRIPRARESSVAQRFQRRAATLAARLIFEWGFP